MWCFQTVWANASPDEGKKQTNQLLEERDQDGWYLTNRDEVQWAGVKSVSSSWGEGDSIKVNACAERHVAASLICVYFG